MEGQEGTPMKATGIVRRIDELEREVAALRAELHRK